MLNRLQCFVVVGTTMFVLGCGSNTVTKIPSTDPEAIAGTQRQKFGVFSFEVPAGWSSVTPDRDKTKAMILLGGTTWQNSKAMIKVDVGTPAFPTAQEMAKDFEKTAGGHLAPETLNFDGETATKVTFSSTSLTTPREVIIIYRDGTAYLIMAGAVDGVDLTNAMEHIRSTWNWDG